MKSAFYNCLITYVALNSELDIANTSVGTQCMLQFLANVNSRSRSLYAIARPSVVCCLSVTFVHPTQAVQIFRNISTVFGTLAIR